MDRFWDVLNVAVDQNYTHFLDIERLIYLKGRWTGDAKQAVSGLLMSNDKYILAKTVLKESFEDTELLKQTHCSTARHYHYKHKNTT